MLQACALIILITLSMLPLPCRISRKLALKKEGLFVEAAGYLTEMM